MPIFRFFYGNEKYSIQTLSDGKSAVRKHLMMNDQSEECLVSTSYLEMFLFINIKFVDNISLSCIPFQSNTRTQKQKQIVFLSTQDANVISVQMLNYYPHDKYDFS